MSLGFGLILMNAEMLKTEVFNAAHMARTVSRCAIEVTVGPALALLPLFEGDGDVAGQYEFSVSAQSAAGRSVSRQTNRFEGGHFVAPQMTVNADAHIQAGLTVTDQGGSVICALEIDYPSSGVTLGQALRQGANHG